MVYTPILATLGYVLSESGTDVLMIHRNRRPEDLHFGKFNGLGGKLDPEEDVVSGMRREILEESGLECEELVLKGTVNWPGFGPKGENWFGFVFRIDRTRGVLRQSNPEGTLEWVRMAGLLDLPMWPGDHHFLPLVFDRSQRQFHGVMPYQDGQPMGWSVSWV